MVSCGCRHGQVDAEGSGAASLLRRLFSMTRLLAGFAALPIALVLGAPAAEAGVRIERHLVSINTSASRR